jgi:tetratricopeptide (TPR) repeat protein
MTGRHLGKELAVSIASLPDEILFSASEVAYTRFDPKKTRTEYERLKNKLWKLANRNGLPDNPDNCARDDENDPLLNEHGRPVLLKGERYPRYDGSTWKGLLYDEDWAMVEAARQEQANTEPGSSSATDLVPAQTAPENSVPSKAATPVAAKVAQTAPALSADYPELPDIVGKAFQAYTWRKIRRFFLGPSATIMGLLLSTLILPAAVGGMRHGFDAILAVYEKQGTAAALTMAICSKDEGFEKYFLSGWLSFKVRESDQSYRIMKDIINDPDAGDYYRAKALYVLGSIELNGKRFQAAEESFQASMHLYQNMGMDIGVGRNQIEMANVLWIQGYLDEAFELARAAERTVTTGIEVDKLYMRLYFQRGEYQKSIDYAYKMLKDDRVVIQATAWLHIGFTATVMGNDPLAREANLKASALIESTGDVNLRFYRHVNEIAYNQCRMTSTDELVAVVTKYAVEKDELLLLDQMSDAKFLCELNLNQY